MGQPNPFWSDEVQKQYMEATREEDAARPSDLANYDDRAQQGEEQQLLEPPYDGAGAAGGSGTTVGLDQEARNLIEAGSQGSGQGGAGRPLREEGTSLGQAPQPALARLETRKERSPDRVSLGHDSEISVRTAASKLEVVERARQEASEPELLPASTVDMGARAGRPTTQTSNAPGPGMG